MEVADVDGLALLGGGLLVEPVPAAGPYVAQDFLPPSSAEIIRQVYTCAVFTSPRLYAAPQDVGFRVGCRTGAIWRFWPNSTGDMQDP